MKSNYHTHTWRCNHARGTEREYIETAKKNGIDFKPVRLSTREEARNAPTPVTTYALFYDGEYVTNEQMNEKKFLKLVKA